MDFSETLTLMKQGRKVRRPTWSEDDYLRINELGHLYSPYGSRIYWLADTDILAIDWEEAEEETEY